MLKKKLAGVITGVVTMIALLILFFYLFIMILYGKTTDTSIFQSARALSANIAIEIPESRPVSSHYIYPGIYFLIHLLVITVSTYITARVSGGRSLYYALPVLLVYWVLLLFDGAASYISEFPVLSTVVAALTVLAAIVGIWMARFHRNTREIIPENESGAT